MKVFRVYTDKRSDHPFADSLIKEVTVVAEDETETLKTVLDRYSDDFHCDDSELLVEAIEGRILSVSY